MAHRVTIERTTECPTAVVKANTDWREFPTLWRTLLDDVWAFLRATPGLRAGGHNVMMYRGGLPKDEVASEVVRSAAPRVDWRQVGDPRGPHPSDRPLRHSGLLAACRHSTLIRWMRAHRAG